MGGYSPKIYWLDEHRQDVLQADFTNSALAEHVWNHSYPVDWDGVKVLCNPQDYIMHRITQEAIHIDGALPDEHHI